MHGLLLIDKPQGCSSHDVVRNVRRLYSTRKVGHAGTLDPLATGVLVVAVGDATKVLQFLFTDDKSYRATFRLGVTTDTFDAQGNVLQTLPVPDMDAETIDRLCNRFRGDILQMPPMFSALKRGGVPLYKYARQGMDVERQSRQVTIQRLNILAVDGVDVTIETDCSKGTYIRSLVHDIGEAIGCGAHLTSLRRLRSGNFHIDQCHTLEHLEHIDDKGSTLLSLSDALGHLPSATLNSKALESLAFGIPPDDSQCQLSGVLSEGEQLRLLDNNKLVAVATYQPQRQKEKRGDFELIRVFI